MNPPVITCPNCGTRNRVAAVAEGVPRCGNCGKPLPWIVSADPEGFQQAISSSLPVLVDFWAPWCGPCKWVEPTVAELAHKRAGHLKVVKLDIDTAPEIAARYEVQGIPALLLIKDGEVQDRLVGAHPAHELDAWASRHLEPAGTA
jgi:thioredoxin 2